MWLSSGEVDRDRKHGVRGNARLAPGIRRRRRPAGLVVSRHVVFLYGERSNCAWARLLCRRARLVAQRRWRGVVTGRARRRSRTTRHGCVRECHGTRARRFICRLYRDRTGRSLSIRRRRCNLGRAPVSRRPAVGIDLEFSATSGDAPCTLDRSRPDSAITSVRRDRSRCSRAHRRRGSDLARSRPGRAT